MYANNKLSWWLYIVGLVIVLGSHIYMLSMGGLSLEEMTAHAVLNIIAGILLATGWFTRKA